jgi:predicted transcriptional regulator
MKNRSRVEILYEIVLAAKEPAKKTHLLYGSNLSTKQLNLYLQFLLERKILSEQISERSKLYVATARGRHFIDTFEKLRSLLGDVAAEELDLAAPELRQP